MTFPPLLDFAAAHPVAATFLAWPLCLFLVSIAWCAASLVTASMSQILNLITSLAQLAVVMVRGYPPVQPVTPDIGPDSAQDDEARPLAS